MRTGSHRSLPVNIGSDASLNFEHKCTGNEHGSQESKSEENIVINPGGADMNTTASWNRYNIIGISL
jgi:hypothetical protein